jgi:hypothetical protein
VLITQYVPPALTLLGNPFAHSLHLCVPTGFSNYDTANMLVTAGRARLVERLRHVYEVLYNENGT